VGTPYEGGKVFSNRKFMLRAIIKWLELKLLHTEKEEAKQYFSFQFCTLIQSEP